MWTTSAFADMGTEERLPFVRPGRLTPQQQLTPNIFAGEHPLPASPYGSRWNVGFKLESVGTHVLVSYRDQLHNMKDDQIIRVDKIVKMVDFVQNTFEFMICKIVMQLY